MEETLFLVALDQVSQLQHYRRLVLGNHSGGQADLCMEVMHGSTSGLCPLDARSRTSPPCCDSMKCVQMLPNIPQGQNHPRVGTTVLAELIYFTVQRENGLINM